MADEVVVVGDGLADEKRGRLFLRNPDSGEPWACVADLPLDAVGKQTVHDFVLAEIEALEIHGERSFTIEAKRKEMTEAEVEALPEM